MDVDMLRRIDDHIRFSDTHRLLGLCVLCGEFGRDWISQEQIMGLALRYGQEYPLEHGVN